MFNNIEGFFWIVLACASAVRSFTCESKFRMTFFALFVLLIFFGSSDFVEARSGAWWQPWWLLVWKAACILGLAIVMIRFFIIKYKDKKLNSK